MATARNSFIVYADGEAVHTCESLAAAMAWITTHLPTSLYLQDVSPYEMDGVQRAWRVQSPYFIEQVDMQTLAAPPV